MASRLLTAAGDTQGAARTKSILMLSPWPSVYDMSGGGTPRIPDLVDALLTDSYRIEFVAPIPQRSEQSWFPENERLRVHRFRTRITPRGYIRRWLAWAERTIRLTTRATAVAVQQGRPDLVYGFSSLTVPAAVICGRLFHCPTIGSLFGTYLYPYLGRRLGLLLNFEETIAFKCPVDRLNIVNDGTRGNDVARALGVPERRVRFWMHGLDLDACDRARDADGRAALGLPRDAPLVVSTSRLVQWKRVDRILRAAPGVLAEKPDALFVFSGEGPEQAGLEALADELKVRHAIRFVGALPRDVNLQLIAAADVCCALYDYSCVGVALLDALGCGVAVVVADTGATRDFVEHGVNGLVVQPDDQVETAAAILSLLRDQEARAQLGNEARRRARERFLTRDARAALEVQMVNELATQDSG